MIYHHHDDDDDAVDDSFVGFPFFDDLDGGMVNVNVFGTYVLFIFALCRYLKIFVLF